MSYTQLAVISVCAMAALDAWVFRTRLLRRSVFWLSYAIILPFQLLTNGVLTGFRMVRYSGSAIIGNSTPVDHAPPILGDGRIFYAPIEDVLFGFSLILLTLMMWVVLGRRGIQREPVSSSDGRLLGRGPRRK
jgi:lycopene cyclase domain-containing protein